MRTVGYVEVGTAHVICRDCVELAANSDMDRPVVEGYMPIYDIDEGAEFSCDSAECGHQRLIDSVF